MSSLVSSTAELWPSPAPMNGRFECTVRGRSAIVGSFRRCEGTDGGEAGCCAAALALPANSDRNGKKGAVTIRRTRVLGARKSAEKRDLRDFMLRRPFLRAA
eukprot:5073448-Prymnesium_polylepis.1